MKCITLCIKYGPHCTDDLVSSVARNYVGGPRPSLGVSSEASKFTQHHFHTFTVPTEETPCKTPVPVIISSSPYPRTAAIITYLELPFYPYRLREIFHAMEHPPEFVWIARELPRSLGEYIDAYVDHWSTYGLINAPNDQDILRKAQLVPTVV